MGRSITLKTDSRGYFFRNLGRLASGSQPKFLLGRDRLAALSRNVWLEGLWALMEDGVWTESGLSVAKAIAAGKPIKVGDAWLPVIRSAEDLRAALTTGQETERDLGPMPASKMTVKHGLELFRRHLRAEHSGGGKLTPWGGALVRQLNYLETLLPDCDFSEFGTAAIEALLHRIANRPEAQTKQKQGCQPISEEFARQLVKRVRAWVRFLHKSSQVPWRHDDDYQVKPLRIMRTAAERAQVCPNHDQVLDLAELKALWQCATPYDRLLMLLALNCGFGQHEVAALRLDEVKLRQRHPSASALNIRSDGSDSWVFRVRGKTDVYGEWRLWPITVRAIEWWVRRRPSSPLPVLMLTLTGKPLNAQTAGGHEKSAIANRWLRLTRLVQERKPAFPNYSFTKLRKTGASLARVEAGPEIAAMYLCLGQPVRSAEELVEAYTTKPWGRLHATIGFMGHRLAEVFASVDDPFPDSWKRQHGPAKKQTTQ